MCTDSDRLFLEFFSSESLRNPGARFVLIKAAKEVFTYDLHTAAGGRERPLSNSDCLLVSSAAPTGPLPNISVECFTAFLVVTSVHERTRLLHILLLFIVV
ncbi:hypothetical protein J6590_036337 [Homalodisca vitripennis]|nr:hypothetical protein J6590_036337 [Homalodisca vitripennis]